MPSKLHYSAPHRARVEGPDATYTTRPWTLDDVASALSAGAWFERGRHEFASTSAAELAYSEGRPNSFAKDSSHA